jgi:tetratricopeptide (TPR) repeat protein
LNERSLEWQFVENVQPMLASGRLTAAAAHLREHWPSPVLHALLSSSSGSVVGLAARCLGLVGDLEDARQLSCLLGHPSRDVAQAAEDALWSVWMRAAGETACEELMAAMRVGEGGEHRAAIAALSVLCESRPDFAEAHHQRALALHAVDEIERAEAAYREALRLNPLHFAAAAGLGHVCIQRGDLAGALRHYRRALHLHPRLDEIREVVPQLDAALERRVVA